ncbi:MAG: hypothetical protein E7571_00065 [Ruminococcaceae bacterium]|nr:hypothetical protein [Oscillospiraceae bacterium]
MTKEQKLQTIMEYKGIKDIEVEVDFISDLPISGQSFDEYEKIKEIKERFRAVVTRKIGVSPNVLKGCDTDDVIELMETIFWIEANGENEVKVVDGKIILDIPSLYPYLENYRIMKKAAELNMISNKSYIDWKLNWNRNTIPNS